MMSDAQLERMVRAVTRADETVEIYDPAAPETVIATIRGGFTKSFTQFDSDPTFNTQFEHTVESAFFWCRTSLLSAVKNGHMARYKGATPNVLYRVMDRRHDGHGMTALVLHK